MTDPRLDYHSESRNWPAIAKDSRERYLRGPRHLRRLYMNSGQYLSDLQTEVFGYDWDKALLGDEEFQRLVTERGLADEERALRAAASAEQGRLRERRRHGWLWRALH